MLRLIALVQVLTSIATASARENNPAWMDQRPVVIRELLNTLEVSARGTNADRERLHGLLTELSAKIVPLPARRGLLFWKPSATKSIDAIAEEFAHAFSRIRTEGVVARRRALELLVQAYLIAGAARSSGPRFLNEVRVATAMLVILGAYEFSASQADIHAYVAHGIPILGLTLGALLWTGARETTLRFDRQFQAPEYAPAVVSANLIERFWTTVGWRRWPGLMSAEAALAENLVEPSDLVEPIPAEENAPLDPSINDLVQTCERLLSRM